MESLQRHKVNGGKLLIWFYGHWKPNGVFKSAESHTASMCSCVRRSWLILEQPSEQDRRQCNSTSVAGSIYAETFQVSRKKCCFWSGTWSKITKRTERFLIRHLLTDSACKSGSPANLVMRLDSEDFNSKISRIHLGKLPFFKEIHTAEHLGQRTKLNLFSAVCDI